MALEKPRGFLKVAILVHPDHKNPTAIIKVHEDGHKNCPVEDDSIIFHNLSNKCVGYSVRETTSS